MEGENKMTTFTANPTTATIGSLKSITPFITTSTILTGTTTGDVSYDYKTPLTAIKTNDSYTFEINMPEFYPEWNCKPDRMKMYNPLICYSNIDPAIVNINIIVPNKVVEVTIFDGDTYTFKQICREPDIFELEYALALAWAKYKNQKQIKQGSHETLTLAGIEWLAKEYLWKYKETKKEFNRALKAYNKWCKEEARKEAEEAERLAVIERRRAKNKKRKEKMEAKKKEEEINTIAEAIKRSKS